MQMQVDLSLCCAMFCVASSSVGYATNTNKGHDVNVLMLIKELSSLIGKKIGDLRLYFSNLHLKKQTFSHKQKKKTC
jgi:hypothetical protein